MSDLADPLAGTPWADWRHSKIAGDASARSYARLTGANDQTVVLMNSGPVALDPFTDMAVFLAQQGLCAPKVLHRADPFLVLEDLGQIDIAKALEAGASAKTLYQAAVDVVVRLKDVTPPPLPVMTPKVAGDMVRITATHYAPQADADVLARCVTQQFDSLVDAPDVLALRDFHAENLIWRPNNSGTDRIGLLDFQDAFIAPPGYDLASLLRDIRRPVAPDVVAQMTDYYCTQTGTGRDSFAPQLASLGAQRNLRILGVFARLIREDAKPKYQALMPRVWANLMADLDHPALQDLRAVLVSQLPTPAQAGFA